MCDITSINRVLNKTIVTVVGQDRGTVNPDLARNRGDDFLSPIAHDIGNSNYPAFNCSILVFQVLCIKPFVIKDIELITIVKL